jgi:hypothetical protein
MIRDRLHWTILRLASLLAPRDQRSEWVAGWRSELWYIPRRGAILFCLGSFRDALWLRRNRLGTEKRTRIHPDSPLSCLVFLGIVAAASLWIAVRLAGLLTLRTAFWRLRVHDLPAACVVMLAISCLLLPAMLAVGRAAGNGHSTPWRGKLRRAVFLALKIVLVQPVMFCGLLVWILTARVMPFALFGVLAAWILTLRWVFTDQQRRCPECLRLLTGPVRVGSSSHTFLEWSGDESICSHGHGFLRVPESATSYSGESQWVDLDDSWRELFHVR